MTPASIEQELREQIAQLQKELRDPADYLARKGVRNTIVFFGSARIKPPAETQAVMDRLHCEFRGMVMKDREEWDELDRASHEHYMSRFYAGAESLAGELAHWSRATFASDEQHLVTTGGGPGIMEAANKGASQAGQPTIGINIEIPTEQRPNPYITPGLSLHFETFPMRKFWLMYFARALVIFPGGIGTLDEFFEIYTLMKTRKAKRYIPIVLFGREYWQELINFETMVRFGTLDRGSLDFFRYCDEVDEAYDFITRAILRDHERNGS
ncbi:LOG family protein [Ruficoccus amylovorans]|uniref:AMP nucleosidase n=1 Tax=Ruficoccus amylovorans TaxID=1804625 RepID=A0A842HDH2_9BACT|nr:LOG family protein [Ruficoccus amylovorans]MBC2593637.1 LOG family protein [Ruficoccus amylovorans]